MPLINNYYGNVDTPQLCKQVDNLKAVAAKGLKALLTWSAPTTDEDSSFVGTRIVRKVGSAPINVNDGAVVYEGTEFAYTDTGLTEGATYYYRAFAYNIKMEYQTAMRAVSIVAISVSNILNDNSWDDIKAVSDAGQGANYWAIGDCKSIILNGKIGELNLSNYSTYAFIIGFDHNSELEGSNRIHFQVGKTKLTDGTDICLCDKKYGEQANQSDSIHYFYMDTSINNTGSWSSSKMRTKIIGTSLTDYSNTFIGALSTELRAALKSVTKYTHNSDNASAQDSVTPTTEYAFLLSEYEVCGTTTGSDPYEASKQMQYSYYSAGNSIIKYDHRNPNKSIKYWLRSFKVSSTYMWCAVSSNGTLIDGNAPWSYGIAPCFCV